ncbi:hypothetical protein PanWU01x14_349020 [Parasponia andersonii]|uniref:Uncharacterized protein n=1 Tax=Parasponia andersonii TaxID=3476 RepID=A0A2P5ABG5_PARAD|nr:hypothetical protein PanWU01x14_349020 [Parasponia andersonii]
MGHVSKARAFTLIKTPNLSQTLVSRCPNHSPVSTFFYQLFTSLSFVPEINHSRALTNSGSSIQGFFMR